MTVAPDMAELAARVDQMTAQLDFITAELMAQRESRERWSEMVQTLVPVTRGAMDVATRELDELSQDVSIEDVSRFARTLVRSLPQIETLLAQLDSLSELMETLTSLSGAGVATLTQTLQTADEKGYFAFARQTTRIADRVVTEYSEEDVQALGDNVVTILDAVKEMTQPEVMGLVQRSALQISEPIDVPPSMFALLKSMRDPQTRRGLARVMAMLHTVGEQQPQGRK